MYYTLNASDVFFFFFSSRRRHTRFDCDWSSDVCSSDLSSVFRIRPAKVPPKLHLRWSDSEHAGTAGEVHSSKHYGAEHLCEDARSEERRVGKGCRYRWGRDR